MQGTAVTFPKRFHLSCTIVQCIFSSSVQCNHAQSEWCAMHNYALDWKPSLILCIGSNESLLRQLQVLGVALGRSTTIPIISKIPIVYKSSIISKFKHSASRFHRTSVFFGCTSFSETFRQQVNEKSHTFNFRVFVRSMTPVTP